MKRVYGTEGTGGKGRSSVMLGDDIADRVQWVSNEFGAAGKSFSVTDGYRPDGAPGDYYVDDASKTSTGGFNQWYAIGQHRRRGAAYAAPVGGSDHAKTGPGQGAIDCSVQDMALRHELMGVVGLIQTDSTESWHFAIRRAPAAWWDRSKVTYPNTVTPKPAPQPAVIDFQEEAMYVVFVAETKSNWLITPTFVRKIVDLPDASAKDTIAGIEKLSKAKIVLPFGEFYGIWSNINAGTKDDSSTGREIQALAKQLAAKS